MFLEVRRADCVPLGMVISSVRWLINMATHHFPDVPHRVRHMGKVTHGQNS